MKKILLSIGLAALAFGVQAQTTWRAQSFLAQGVQSVYVTNLVAITNLNTASANTTNAPGTAWSNYVNGGTSLYVVATNSAVSGAWTNATKNLLKDVSLWARRDGAPAFVPSATNATALVTLGDAQLVVRIASGGSGANTAASLVFTPLYGTGMDESYTGLNPRPTPVEGVAADEWTVGITSAGTASVTVTTNVPTYRWPGARGLRLRRIVHADADASSQIIVNEVSLNGYVP